MSRASKLFLGASILISTGTVWGVHYIQVRESEAMYQGVIRDEERLRQKALLLQESSTPTSTNFTTPLNTPSSPVQQPAAVISEDCETCKVSPPAQLVESMDKESRARERQERADEYQAQRKLAATLSRAQGVSEGARMV